jgi:hypothetical protein
VAHISILRCGDDELQFDASGTTPMDYDGEEE